MPSNRDSERAPLLQNGQQNGHQNGHQNGEQHEETVEFDSDGDDGNPREWPQWRKYFQVAQITTIAFICPMASSIFAPASSEIASDFQTESLLVRGGQATFVCMLGIGPLFFAPMSETFGRRNLFVGCLAIFTLTQIATALAGNVEAFIVIRAFAGFFGSVGVANGGGTIFDLFETHERAPVLGVYLVAPLLAPSVGPLIGALAVTNLGWRWIFWIEAIVAGVVTVFCYFFLYETNSVAILQARKNELEKKHPDTQYSVEGQSNKSIPQKIAGNSSKAVRILLTQPIVAIMSSYQALIFSTMYSLFSEFNSIWTQSPYKFDKIQIGLTYMGPVIGFIAVSIFVVIYIDTIYNYYSKKNNDDGEPEYRLPFANLGAVLLPISLFGFGWSIEEGVAWPVPFICTILFGASQVSIFNPVQTYYIDSYAENAASALAAGAFFRSIIGGVVPLFVSKLFTEIGYEWGMSVFGGLSLVLMPAPLVFIKYGKYLRENYPFKG